MNSASRWTKKAGEGEKKFAAKFILNTEKTTHLTKYYVATTLRCLSFGEYLQSTERMHFCPCLKFD